MSSNFTNKHVIRRKGSVVSLAASSFTKSRILSKIKKPLERARTFFGKEGSCEWDGPIQPAFRLAQPPREKTGLFSTLRKRTPLPKTTKQSLRSVPDFPQLPTWPLFPSSTCVLHPLSPATPFDSPFDDYYFSPRPSTPALPPPVLRKRASSFQLRRVVPPPPSSTETAPRSPPRVPMPTCPLPPLPRTSPTRTTPCSPVALAENSFHTGFDWSGGAGDASDASTDVDASDASCDDDTSHTFGTLEMIDELLDGIDEESLVDPDLASLTFSPSIGSIFSASSTSSMSSMSESATSESAGSVSLIAALHSIHFAGKEGGSEWGATSYSPAVDGLVETGNETCYFDCIQDVLDSFLGEDVNEDSAFPLPPTRVAVAAQGEAF